MKKLSKEELFYLKLKNDKKWYIENFLKIRDKKSNLVPFVLNDAQNIVMEKIKWCEENDKLKRFIVLKARQMGLSTLFEGLIYQDTTTNSFKNSMIIAHEDKATQNLFAMSKLFYDEIPDVLKPMVKYSNEKALVFENPSNDITDKRENPGLRSKITVATAGTTEAGRSATIHNLHASEVAFFPDARVTMLGLLQSVPDEMNTLVVLESTANGVGDWFHDMWQKAVKGENEFIPVFLPWFTDKYYVRPFRSEAEREQFIDEITITTTNQSGERLNTYEYDLMIRHNLTLEQMNWRKYTVANKCQGSEELFMQEYPSTAEEAFLSTGRPKFSIKSLKKYQTITKPPIKTGYLTQEANNKVSFREDAGGYISIWEEPQVDRFYCIGADVAEGLIKGDYSCGLVGDTQTFDIVAMWHGHIDPDLFGIELVKLAIYYNEAYLGVENNNHGGSTLTAVKNAEYWNIYFTKKYDRIADIITQKIGWSTDLRTKPLMIDKLAAFVRETHLGIYSDLIISEMFTYVIDDKGHTNAQSGCYDDSVIACAILLQLLLEGKSEDYEPEIAIDDRGKRLKREIIDPLFEVDDSTEYSE